MATKKLTIKGETVEYAIKRGLSQLGLSQDRTLIKILQKDSQGFFGHKDAVVAIVYDDEESEAALNAKIDKEFRSKFKFRFVEQQAQIQVPACFYEDQYVHSAEERQEFLEDFLRNYGVDHPDDQAISKVVEDFQCQYSFIPVKDFETEPLNNRESSIHLMISDDKMLCRAIIFHGEITHEEEVFNVLKKRHIVKGIMRKNLQHVLKTGYCGYFTLAQGEPAVDDTPGAVEKFFQENEHKEFSKMMEMLTIDTRSVKEINIAERHQLLIKLGDVITGSDGYTIEGDAVPKKEVAESEGSIKLGPNVYASDNGKEIYAKESGHIVWKSDERFIDVEPVYIVEGNVDFSEGNIHGFVGKVIIKGDVKPKFSVVAQGDIEIHGTVEDAVVKSTNGNVLVAQSVIHKNEGTIQAKESIHCSIATNADLHAKNIIIEKEAMNSFMEAENQITITSNPGVLIGGETHVKNVLLVKTVGSESSVPTKLHIGDVSQIKNRLRSLTQKGRDTAMKLKEAKEVINILSYRSESEELDIIEQQQLERAQKEIPNLEDYIKYCQEQKEILEKEIEERRPARLEVLETLYSHVDIFLFEGHFIPQSPEKHTGFHYKKGRVQRYSL